MLQPLTGQYVISAVLSSLAACALLAAMASIAFRRPGLAMIFFFPFFAFAGRLVSTLYIDLFGPVPSEQLETEIGPGAAAVPLAISQGLVLAALLLSFHNRRLRSLFANAPSVLTPAGFSRISSLAFWSVLLFTVGLWIELVASGPIPLFAAMERYDYSQQYGGPLHHRLIEWGAMLSFQLGVFFVAPTFRGRRFDRRFGFLIAALILYLFLVGHRFSSFYTYGSFFLIPIGVVLLAEQLSGRKLFLAPVLRRLGIAGVGLLGLTVAALAYSYTFVRGFEGDTLAFKLTQRLLVQQGEMWWMTYARVFLHGDWNGGLAAYKLFIDPFDPSRNSTMQFLMELGLPLERAHYILGLGSSYTGGWPEAFFELGGPLGGFALVALSAIVFSEFMFLTTRCIVQERFATCFFLVPILYAFSLAIVSGMLNSLIQMTFFVKIVAAMLVYVAEDNWRASLILSRQSAGSRKEYEKGNDMITPPGMVSGDKYLRGLFTFLCRTMRRHLLLLILLPLVAMAVAYLAAPQLPPVYSAQGSIRIGRVDGTEAPVGAVSRINSSPFKQSLVQAMNLSLPDNSRSAQLIFSSLTARQETADSVAVTVRATTAQQAREALIAVVGLLNEQKQKIRGPLEADLKEQLATYDTTIAGLLATRESLSVLAKDDPKEVAADPTAAALSRMWLLDLLSRNDQRLSQARAERRALSIRLGAWNTYPAALVDDAFVSTGSAVARPVAIAIFAGGVVFLMVLTGILFRESKVARSV